MRLQKRETDGATALILVAQDCCLLAPFSFSNFCPPLMRTNLATRLYSCLFYLLCVIPLWTRPIERIFASSSLLPSLQTSSEASGLEKSSGGVGGLGWVQPFVGGSKVSLHQAGSACGGQVIILSFPQQTNQTTVSTTGLL